MAFMIPGLDFTEDHKHEKEASAGAKVGTIDRMKTAIGLGANVDMTEGAPPVHLVKVEGGKAEPGTLYQRHLAQSLNQRYWKGGIHLLRSKTESPGDIARLPEEVQHAIRDVLKLSKEYEMAVVDFAVHCHLHPDKRPPQDIRFGKGNGPSWDVNKNCGKGSMKAPPTRGGGDPEATVYTNQTFTPPAAPEADLTLVNNSMNVNADGTTRLAKPLRATNSVKRLGVEPTQVKAAAPSSGGSSVDDADVKMQLFRALNKDDVDTVVTLPELEAAMANTEFLDLAKRSGLDLATTGNNKKVHSPVLFVFDGRAAPFPKMSPTCAVFTRGGSMSMPSPDSSIQTPCFVGPRTRPSTSTCLCSALLQDAKRLLKSLDKNDDGGISINEFLQGIEKLKKKDLVPTAVAPAAADDEFDGFGTSETEAGGGTGGQLALEGRHAQQSQLFLPSPPPRIQHSCLRLKFVSPRVQIPAGHLWKP